MKNQILWILFSIIIILAVFLLGFFSIKLIHNILPKESGPRISLKEIYYSDFKSPNELDNWQSIDTKNLKIKNIRWQIENEKLTQIALKNDQNKPFYESIIFIKNASDWQNYQVDLKFNHFSKGYLAFLVHFQDHKNYYQIQLKLRDDKKSANASMNKLINNRYGVLARSKNAISLNNENNIKIIINDSYLTMYINNQIVIEAKDDNLKTGSLGIQSSFDSGAQFDDITVLNLSLKSQNNNSQVLSGKDSISDEKSEEENIDSEIKNLIDEIGL